MKGRIIGGDGKVAEVDGGYFGGYVKPSNLAANRVDRRRSSNQSGKRKAVVVIRERNGNSLPAMFRTEGQALSFIRSRVAKGTTLNADEARTWDDLHARYEMKRINHEEAYTLDSASTNWPRNTLAACAVPRLDTIITLPVITALRARGVMGENNRRLSNGEQVNRLAGLALHRKPSVDFSGYWQRHVLDEARYPSSVKTGRVSHPPPIPPSRSWPRPHTIPPPS